MDEKKIGLVDKVKNYFKETLAEAKKVSWPDKKYVWSATTIIIVLVVFLSVMIMAIDYGLSQFITMFTRVR